MNQKLPFRKNIRLNKDVYSLNASYFITICTHNRKCFLSQIVESDASGNCAVTQLSTYGKIVENAIMEIPENYSDVKVESYVIMPNHIHMILTKGGRADPSPTDNFWDEIERGVLDATQSHSGPNSPSDCYSIPSRRYTGANILDLVG